MPVARHGRERPVQTRNLRRGRAAGRGAQTELAVGVAAPAADRSEHADQAAVLVARTQVGGGVGADRLLRGGAYKL